MEAPLRAPPLSRLHPVVADRAAPAIAALLIAAALALAWTSAGRKSVTVDEVAHLPQGLLYWSSGHPGATFA